MTSCTFTHLRTALLCFFIFICPFFLQAQENCQTQCLLSNWGNADDPLNHGIYIYHSPADPRQEYGEFSAYQRFLWESGTGNIDMYEDSAIVTGCVYNKMDPSMKFDVYIKLTDYHSWDTWSEKGRSWMAQREPAYEVAEREYPFWTYSIIDPKSKLVGKGSVEGTLYLSHAPVDQSKGVQMGWGANDKDGDYGLGGWFGVKGELIVNGENLNIDTQGDINVDMSCSNCESAGAFPVTLSNFELIEQNREYIELSWVTQSEFNSLFFQLERAVDNGPFEPVSRLEAAGNSQQFISYATKDFGFYGESLLYRLKQVDIDGTFSFSHVIPVSLNRLKRPYHIHPNPANSTVWIRTTQVEEGSYYLVDMRGKKIKEGQLSLTGSTSFNVKGIPAGVYLLQLELPSYNEAPRKLLIR